MADDRKNLWDREEEAADQLKEDLKENPED